ncbi:ankyrin repeat domain-containing protein [Streptomyces sp. CA-210063]|uniref:ankyrin repeat domain-containing protein n=1 Tax=Streptomyces sp. CA-210063 TaxID=2801029 RepID=UPI00214B7570|nr:ankyrin repeat domain-containing protein [Streptomyces sp. CA-210063]UUU30802.1 ankyrin repeat domain-containing protein [Streptomyces sp. CA-210063]
MFEEVENLWTPAHQAVENGESDELARLLDSGVDPDEICCGMTLLAHAVDYEADTAIQAGREMGVTLVAILLAYGADPQIEGSQGKSPLELADDYQHVMAERLLLRFFRSA